MDELAIWNITWYMLTLDTCVHQKTNLFSMLMCTEGRAKKITECNCMTSTSSYHGGRDGVKCSYELHWAWILCANHNMYCLSSKRKFTNRKTAIKSYSRGQYKFTFDFLKTPVILYKHSGFRNWETIDDV